MLDIFSSYLNPDEAVAAEAAASVVQVVDPSQSEDEFGHVGDEEEEEEEVVRESVNDKILEMNQKEPNELSDSRNLPLLNHSNENRSKEEQEKESVIVENKEEVDVVASPWWFLNPFSIFNIRKRLNLQPSSKSSKLLKIQTANNKTRVPEEENNNSSKLNENLDQTNNILKETNLEQTTKNPSNAETQISSSLNNASNFFEANNLPPRLNDLDLATKKEIPKSTVESGSSSVSPAYRLIKEAFSEFQLFSKACK